MTDAKDVLRADENALLAALRESGADVSRPKLIKCPFHDDKTPSGGVYQGDDGAWRFKCQAASCGFAGDVFDVRSKATGQKLEDILREYQRQHGDQPPLRRASVLVAGEAEPPRTFASIADFKKSYSGTVTLYPYTDPDTGNIDLIKLRIERLGQKKTFVQAHLETPGADGKVIVTAPPKPWPLFNRKRLREGGEVLFVEGEKVVTSLTRVGQIATCVSGGGGPGSAKSADLTPLHGKTVFFWPDHDPVDPKKGTRGGHEHMREVIAECQRVGVKIEPYWIDPDLLGMGDKQDAHDYLARYDADSFADAIDAAKEIAEPLSRAAKYRKHNDDSIEGRKKTIAFPMFSKLGTLTKALQPGTITMFCGQEGSTKSLLMMQLFTQWTVGGVSVAVFMLEDDVNMHVDRAVAQLAGEQGMTDNDWKQSRPEEARRHLEIYRPITDRLLEGMDDAPETALNYADMLAWIQRRCDTGARILIIDPVTALDAGKESWRSDMDFMIKAKSIIRRHGASLIFVTHPRPGFKGDKPTSDNMAGGRAFPRFSQTVMWITYHNGKRRVESSYGMTLDEQVDRVIHLLKVRNGRGDRMRVAVAFDKLSLRFRELGVDTGPIKRLPDGGVEEKQAADAVGEVAL